MLSNGRVEEDRDVMGGEGISKLTIRGKTSSKEWERYGNLGNVTRIAG
jgi:hypothetical protein